jgi:hypothetical protein
MKPSINSPIDQVILSGNSFRERLNRKFNRFSVKIEVDAMDFQFDYSR